MEEDEAIQRGMRALSMYPDDCAMNNERFALVGYLDETLGKRDADLAEAVALLRRVRSYTGVEPQFDREVDVFLAKHKEEVG